jgi:glutaminyl-peptide cyclotransferase
VAVLNRGGSPQVRPARLRMVTVGVAMAGVAFVMATAGCGGNGSGNSATGPPNPLRVEVLGELPWDPAVFTQGVEYDGPDQLLVSSGLYGSSNLRQIDPGTGTVERSVTLDPAWFAEGLTIARTDEGRSLILLTWKEDVAVWFDPVTLAELRRVPFDAEGWGICQLDDGRIVTSDGSSRLTFRDVDTLAATGSVPVIRDGQPVERLNELDCDGATVWANVWQTDRIHHIDVASGRVVDDVDASGLLDRTANPGADVLNGIARIPGTDDEFLLTGKRWPTAFRVRFVPA